MANGRKICWTTGFICRVPCPEHMSNMVWLQGKEIYLGTNLFSRLAFALRDIFVDLFRVVYSAFLINDSILKFFLLF